tara:strand:- start:81 stop:488 length:408 start_codon:yes stop_codon:yes gene_type:complete
MEDKKVITIELSWDSYKEQRHVTKVSGMPKGYTYEIKDHIEVPKNSDDKYLVAAVGNTTWNDKFVAKWHGLPEKECRFYSDIKRWNGINMRSRLDKDELQKLADRENLILVIDLPKGSKYKQKSNEIKTESLLRG